MPDSSDRTAIPPRSKPPSQGALVVLLVAMLMVNVSVLIVVVAGGWFDKRGPGQGEAIAQAEPTRSNSRQDAPRAERSTPARQANRSATTTPRPSSEAIDTSAAPEGETPAVSPGLDVPVTPAALPAPAPIEVQPVQPVSNPTPQAQPGTTETPIDFFGIPVLE
ncbi:MAG: hypothetical protein ACIAXF_08375 [Phycisphaerales bacterium JB063]